MLNETVLEKKKSQNFKIKKVVILDQGTVISEQLVEQLYAQGDLKSNPTRYDPSYVKRLNLDGLHALEEHQPDLILLITDTPVPVFEKQVLEKCREMQIPVLPVRGKGSMVLIGPYERPGNTGCVTCLDLRWEHSILRTNLKATLKQQQSVNPFEVHFGLNQSELRMLINQLIVELSKVFDQVAGEPETDGNVGIYRRDGEVEWIPLLPSHDCPRCHLRPIDDTRFAELKFESHSVRDHHSLRVKKIDHDYLNRLYVDRNMGYISSISELGTEGKYVRATARIQTPHGSNHAGHGSGFTVKEARQKAILEVVERLCGVKATNRRPVVISSYNEIQDTAVDPTRFGLHDEAFFRHTTDYFQPYSPDNQYSWVWAYSTRRQQPILVPEQIAYYGGTRDIHRFLKESSSGCALGGTIEEASLFGIFEVLERDGFLNMWYGQLPVPELKLGDKCPTDVFDVYSLVKKRGYDVRFFNLSYDINIPAILAVGIHQDKNGARVICGSSCHLNPYEAVDGALREMYVQVLHIDGISEKRRQQGYEMLKNPKKIQEILDHVVVASLPEAYPRWKFLLERTVDDSIQSIEDVYGSIEQGFAVETGDIHLILESVLGHVHQKGFDVVIVNLTNAEAALGGLFAAKALIPGMTPITFGYGGRRVQGLKRLFELPYKLGYTSKILTPEDLNHYCHPFA